MSSTLTNEFDLSDDDAAIQEGVCSIVTRFGDVSWLARDDGTRATPDPMAGKIFAAAAKERRLLLPDAVSRSSWWLSRLAPPFL